MGNWVKQYTNDPFGSFLSTPVTTSGPTTYIMSKLPVYRTTNGLSSFAGLEIGMAHGYFLMGPFVTLGPLRNSEVANLAGLLSVVGLLFILSAAIIAYGISSIDTLNKDERIQKQNEWWKFCGGFLLGGFGGAGVAYELLSYIKIL